MSRPNRSKSIVSTPSFHITPLQIALFLAFAGNSGAFAQEAPNSVKPTDQTLPPIEVRADAENQQLLQRPVSNGALGAKSQLDTPFSTTVVGGEDLTDRQVKKLGEVFSLDASASDNSNAYNSWASYLTVRGMQLDWQNGYRIDGLPFVGYGMTMPYDHFEQIELLKGLSGFMYGFVTPGGVVNYVTKKPTATPVRQIDVGIFSDNVWSEHIDLGGRAGEDQRFGYRINYTHEDGKLFSGTQIKRDSFSLALDAKLTQDLTWSFNSIYQDRRTTAQSPSFYTGSYVSGSLPSPISGARKDLAGGDQHLGTTLQLYTTGLQYQLNPDWSLSADYSYSAVTRSRNEGTYYLTNSSGAYTEARYDGAQGHRYTQLQAMLQGRFRTGPFSHQLVLGAAGNKQLNDYSANDVFTTLAGGNINNANNNMYYSTTGFRLYRNSDISQQSAFVSDTMQLSERWSILGGLRYTNYEQNSYNTAGATTSVYRKNVTTPTVALMYKPEPNTTLYGSYVESLEPGSLVGVTYANSGAQLKPLTSKQYEVGAKTDQSKWSATAAVFRIERGAEYANASNVLVQDGLSIFQGLELGAALSPSASMGAVGQPDAARLLLRKRIDQ